MRCRDTVSTKLLKSSRIYAMPTKFSDRQPKSLTFHNCYQNFHFLLRKAIANYQKVALKQKLDKKKSIGLTYQVSY
ncbi:hypothetical protein [Okeania sp. KiyG1]|uniref:hypothetical protein n=1 Tax=Okeania sp. KiyG1 TaxID=2720165 RepID=UPI00192191A2|nr:hypothetical protein [Okeania sp. KiyG1]